MLVIEKAELGTGCFNLSNPAIHASDELLVLPALFFCFRGKSQSI